MQQCQIEDQTRQADMRKARIAARQARVGIIANATTIPLPAHPPREVWTRWPKLRSSRRHGAESFAVRDEPASVDPVLSGELLKDLRRDLCAQQPVETPVTNAFEPLLSDPSFAPPPTRTSPVILLASCVLAGALGLIALSLILS